MTDDLGRDPDPTLHHHEGTGFLSHIVAIGDLFDRVPVAHRCAIPPTIWDPAPACGAKRGRLMGEWSLIPTDKAKWFSRPCRRCFRGAPLPGQVPDGRWGIGLEWQRPTMRRRA